MSHFLLELVRNHAANQQRGIYSVCSAHPWVLEAAMRRHLPAAGPLLIEATCNQVNQFGGYTGMTPGRFRESVYAIARKTGFPLDRILLGGDHLGPFPWQHLPAEQAMSHACEMVRLFVQEGYSKIHLDASLPCAGEPDPLPEGQIAERAARLCAAAESAAAKTSPVYIIGTEVPRPGGALDEMELAVTSPDAAETTLNLHRRAFAAAGLDAAWPRVIALVVQPGVEFSHDSVLDYQPGKASPLTARLALHPGLVYEAHSTDYQRPEALAALVRDGFAILKVGPGLTYAMRQALFALAAIEKELFPTAQQSQLPQWLEEAMLRHPEQWQKHYSGTPEEQQLLRVHSYSDRIRYYWNVPSVQQAVDTLLRNLQQRNIPETLLSDYLPAQYRKVRTGSLQSAPVPILLDAVGEALDPYISATQA
ncbi:MULTISPECIES: D-tagatose-bisphosphate aldolase, class II, non-catalytic subunit [Acidobacterium]|uniref:D-tagatose-bisphosphate aldolase, class II, non-catalytic subunit n=1 Tax=Acidobacterium capsulatum (strain ATCC 51196 / DSM 11244 / BCRC 80197 / JCM 7670 / NBRC 15755 / NCIMB 13165 / 161) TaxID=240015 RepID=C1F2V9_ACIC5|nr:MULTISPECIES: D-tagatose-bisphosphate aldolase, class II, non-catalytic subunit [Acidobacterium]ACO33902.1 D-tagatose-bisphosphate aldolase, class II, non-catalytic subunit [Acidobacterium capsulatum ATCC 51196]HCT60102.1 D-tagatose-bisphosphate aldolase, class II, non-catalytic subunit [Acidobacterium sp.]